MTTTPNMGLTESTPHGSSGIWGDALNAALDLIDSHDHSTGKGVLVPVASLKANSDVSWSFGGTNFAIKDLKAIDFAPVTAASVAGFAGALFVNSADSELYYRTIGGSNVKVTNGAALNFAAFVGGIGGDYSAVGALESFDDATKRYLFQSEGAPRPWSGMACADIDLYEKNISIVNHVTLKSPAGLGASCTVFMPGCNTTFPAALPGAVTPLVMDATGVITTTAQPTVYRLGDFQKGFSVKGATGAGVSFSFSGSNNWQADVSAAGTAYFHFDGFANGDRIKKITFLESDAGTASTYTIFIGGNAKAATLTTSVIENTLTLNAAYTMTASVPNSSYGDPYIILRVVAGSGIASIISGFMVTYDHP